MYLPHKVVLLNDFQNINTNKVTLKKLIEQFCFYIHFHEFNKNIFRYTKRGDIYQTAVKARPACMVFSKPSIACLRVLNTDIMLH